MSNLQWDRADATRDVPVVDGNFWRGVRNAIVASVFCWGIIIGLGWLGYRLGQAI